MSIDDIRLHPSTVQHSVNAVCSKILLADTFNDELFIDGASDSSVNEKYLYVVFAGTNSSYSTVAYDITMKYEFIIKPELKHVVQPAPSVAADNGLVKAAKQVAANLNNSDHPLVRHSMNNILGSFTDFFSRPLGRAAIGAGIATVAKSALTPNNLMKLSPLLLGCLQSNKINGRKKNKKNKQPRRRAKKLGGFKQRKTHEHIYSWIDEGDVMDESIDWMYTLDGRVYRSYRHDKETLHKDQLNEMLANAVYLTPSLLQNVKIDQAVVNEVEEKVEKQQVLEPERSASQIRPLARSKSNN